MRGVSHSYKIYTKSSLNPVDITTYRQIIGLYIKYIIGKLSDGNIVRLPEGLGELAFVGKKIKPETDEKGNIKRLTINWKETKEYWEADSEAKQNKRLIYHFNEHTCGIRYRFIWYKKGSIIKNKNFYIFVPARALKRMFAKLIINEQKEFIVNERTSIHKVSIKN